MGDPAARELAAGDPFGEGWRTRDLDRWIDALAPDVVLHSPLLTTPFQGREVARELYGVLFDGDCQALYYRKDVFTNKDNQAKFKAKMGYDLPVPPKTMKEMHDLATFFTGWDWSGSPRKTKFIRT